MVAAKQIPGVERTVSDLPEGELDAQRWSYNATLRWAGIVRAEPLYGPLLAGVAAALTALTTGMASAAGGLCAGAPGPSSQLGLTPCRRPGHCRQGPLLDAVAALHDQLELDARRLLGDLEGEWGAFHVSLDQLAAQGAAMAFDPPLFACGHLKQSLEGSAAEDDGCTPATELAVACVRGLSERSIAEMARMHVLQILAGASVTFPSIPFVALQFAVEFGHWQEEILVQLLRSTERNQTAGTAGPGHLSAALVGVGSGRTPAALLRELPSLRVLLVNPFGCADGLGVDGACQSVAALPQTSHGGSEHSPWLRRFRDRATVVLQQGVEAARWVAGGSLDLAFLCDGRSHQEVAQDLDSWWPAVRRGGVLAGCRYGLHSPSLVRAVHNWVFANGLQLLVGPDHVWWVRRPDPAGRDRQG